MPARIPELSAAQAQLLMSQLIDGELAPGDADALDAYLTRHPEAIDWMESLSITRPEEPPADHATAIAAITAAIAAEPSRSQPGVLLRFPNLFRPLAAAAALALTFGLAWLALSPKQSAIAHMAPATVEFVDSEIPDASTFVYSDQESGWTVVWVESIAPTPTKHG